MNFELWLAYVGAVLLLMSTPGPSQLLMLSNSLGNGFRRSIATAVGDLSANVLQMTAAALGLAAAIQASREVFLSVKWAGVAYLVFIGLAKLSGRTAARGAGAGRTKSLGSLYRQGFVTSAANPKAVVFFAALFPQFVDPSFPSGAQFLLLGATYVVMDAFFLGCYGRFAGWIGQRIQGPSAKRADRITGALLILAALLLGSKELKPAD